MALQVVNVKTGFKDDGSVHPRVINRQQYSFEDLVVDMSDGTAIPKSDMLAMWEQAVKVIKNYLKIGYRVRTPLGDMMLGLRKSSIAEDNPNQIDASGMHLIFRANDEMMEQLRKETKIQVLDAHSPQAPIIWKVTNPRNNNTLNSAHAGKVINITGSRLGFDPDDAECGVFLWNGGGREAAQRSVVYSRIGSARIDVEVPDGLPPGEYTMEVRTRPTNTDVRIGLYEKKIQVETL